MFSLSLDDLEAFATVGRNNVDIIASYHTFFESARREVSNLERNLNAQLLSRTGFVFQDIKDEELSVSNEISERLWSTNNTECIDEANNLLRAASDVAGTSSMGAYDEIIQRISYTRYFYVYPSITQLARQVSVYSVEPLSLLGYFDPVNNFNGVSNALSRQVNSFDQLFEQYVDQVISEMINLNRYGWELHGILIASLAATQQQFATSVQEVRSVLATNC